MTAPSRDSLPGWDLVQQGLRDAAAGQVTIESCLVSIARPRLEAAGLFSHPHITLVPEPERVLYRLLREEGGDAYGCYNSLLRRLVSFQRSLARHNL